MTHLAARWRSAPIESYLSALRTRAALHNLPVTCLSAPTVGPSTFPRYWQKKQASQRSLSSLGLQARVESRRCSQLKLGHPPAGCAAQPRIDLPERSLGVLLGDCLRRDF